MGNINFGDMIFNEVFEKKDVLSHLKVFASDILQREISDVQILDSNFLQETEQIFSVHLLLNADNVALWFVFAFGEERDYFKEEYYCQTNEGRRLYESPPAIRYNINKICKEFDSDDKKMVKEYGFILELFGELVDLDRI